MGRPPYGLPRQAAASGTAAATSGPRSRAFPGTRVGCGSRVSLSQRALDAHLRHGAELPPPDRPAASRPSSSSLGCRRIDGRLSTAASRTRPSHQWLCPYPLSELRGRSSARILLPDAQLLPKLPGEAGRPVRREALRRSPSRSLTATWSSRSRRLCAASSRGNAHSWGCSGAAPTMRCAGRARRTSRIATPFPASSPPSRPSGPSRPTSVPTSTPW